MSYSACSVDWNRINNELSLAILDGGRLGDLLGELGCKEGRRGWCEDKFRLPCPIHGGKADSVQIETHGRDIPIRWTCFSERCHDKWKPSLLGLVRGVFAERDGKTSTKHAADFLRKFAKTGRPTSVARPLPKPVEPSANVLNLSRQAVRQTLAIPSPYFVSRGFSPEILDRFDVGHSAKLNREVIPLYDERGDVCIGFEGRSSRPRCETCGKHHDPGDCRYGQSKWMGMAGFPKSSYLFNYANAMRSPHDFILVVEGAPDVLRVAEAGFDAVALLGSDVSAAQLAKLSMLKRPIWLCLDNDEAGRKARTRFWERQDECEIRFAGRSLYMPSQYKDVGETPVDIVIEAIEQSLELPF